MLSVRRDAVRFCARVLKSALFSCTAFLCGPALAQTTIRAADLPGADASVKINACIGAVIRAGGGTCDASGLGGHQIMSQEIKLGDPARGPGGPGMALLLPDAAHWSWHLTDPTSCGLRQYGGTALIGHGPGGGGNRMVLEATSGSNMDAIYCTDNPKNDSSYIRAEGFAVWNNQPGSTFKNGVIHIVNVVDQSSFVRIFGENYFGDVWHVESACCAVRFENIHATSNGSFIKNGAKGGIPLTIGPGKVDSISFYDSSVNQPGLGLPDILIRGGGTYGVNFFGLYMEGNGGAGGDPKTAMVFISKDVGPVHFIGGVATTEQGALHYTKPVFENHGSIIEVSNFEAVSTSIGIVDAIGGTTVPVESWKGNLGTIPYYRTKLPSH